MAKTPKENYPNRIRHIYQYRPTPTTYKYRTYCGLIKLPEYGPPRHTIICQQCKEQEAVQKMNRALMGLG